eukprot:545548-Prymnesium_polylepis.1
MTTDVRLAWAALRNCVLLGRDQYRYSDLQLCAAPPLSDRSVNDSARVRPHACARLLACTAGRITTQRRSRCSCAPSMR